MHFVAEEQGLAIGELYKWHSMVEKSAQGKTASPKLATRSLAYQIVNSVHGLLGQAVLGPAMVDIGRGSVRSTKLPKATHFAPQRTSEPSFRNALKSIALARCPRPAPP